MPKKYAFMVLIILFLFLIKPVFAEHNTNLTVIDSRGLCLREGKCQYCENNTMSLEGTNDHVLYLEKANLYDDCKNKTEIRDDLTVNLADTFIDEDFLIRFMIIGFVLFAVLNILRRLRND